MTLILRSDRRALNSLGSANGYTGPLDFAAMLDFSRGDYFKMAGGNRVDLRINQAVSVTRSTVGVARRPDGSRYTVPLNAPRISYNRKHGMSGLLIEGALQNLVTNPANGSSVTIPNASGFIILSYEGGDASLTSPNLTLSETFSAEGRTCKRYTRAAGTYTATLNVSGGAVDIQAVRRDSGEGYYPGHFMGYGASQGADFVQLAPDTLALIAGGNYSVVAQFIMNTAGVNSLNYCNALRSVSSAPFGGAAARTARYTGQNGTDEARTFTDGAIITAGTTRASINGTWNDVAVIGLTCQNNGDSVGLISYGQYGKAVGLGAQSGGPAAFHVGGMPGDGKLIGGILARMVIYNRMLTDTEAWAVANAWR